MTTPMNETAEQIAAGLTARRQWALAEVADAGEAGLGFGRCSLQARKYLRAKGLIERLPPSGGFFEPVREICTPLGLAVATILKAQP